MSFIDSIGSTVKSIGGFLKSNSIGASLAKTALLGLALNQVQKSINKQTDAQQDKGRELQLNPNTENNIPVVYGEAYVKGIVTDAALSNDNAHLWVCLTICEKTGPLISGTASSISIDEVYWDGLRLVFQDDGITLDKAYDEDANSVDWSGLIKVYPYSGGSTSPINLSTEIAGNTDNAYDIFPNWSSTNDMSNLVFAIVKVTYDSKRGITGLGEMQFKVTNTMNQPGDCLNDYMTNTRYGAGIPAGEINQ